MNIEVRSTYYSVLILVNDTNVSIEYDASSLVYPKDENGQPIYSLPYERSVENRSLDMMGEAMAQLVRAKKEEWYHDSLVEDLFEKMPLDIARELLNKLQKEYGEDK